MKRTWLIADWFAAATFIAVGSMVFSAGYRAFSPPPPPPGAALCGNAILGGLFLMVIGAPASAIVSSLATGALVRLISRLLNRFAA